MTDKARAKTLSQDQIRALQGFTGQVTQGRDRDGQDFLERRKIIEILDVEATLAMKVGEWIVYVGQGLNKERRRARDSP